MYQRIWKVWYGRWWGIFYNVTKAIVYSLLLNSGIFLIAILICCYLQDVVRATSVTAIIIFALSLYLGYGMMLQLPVAFYRFIRSGSLSAGTHFSAGCYSGRGDMVGHTDIAFVDKIS